MRRFYLLLAIAAVAAAASPINAQNPFALELRVGGAFPTADLGDATLATGGGFEVNGSFRLMPHLRTYAGWQWQRFATDTPFAGADYDVEDTGYGFGLQFQHPLSGPVWGWARAGGLYDHIELEDGASIVVDSAHELGWEVGTGLYLPIGARAALTPGVRYRSFTADLQVDRRTIPVDLRYVALDVGFSWAFGEPDRVPVPVR